MPTKMEFIPTESQFGVTIQHRLLHSNMLSRKLMAILPGRAYTTDSPLLHYQRRVGLAQRFDVLLVSYGFYFTQGDISLANMPKVYADATDVIKKALEQGYDELCIVGKSLGSPIAATLANSLDVPRKSLLLFTPIQNATELVNDIPTLAVIGTADPAYKRVTIKNNNYLQWKVYEGLNHSMEYGNDWQSSIEVLQQIMNDCEQWIIAQSVN